VNRLQSQLHRQVGPPVELFQQGIHVVGNGIGPGADKQPDNVLEVENNFIFLPQLFHRCVGIAVGLIIGNIFDSPMALYEMPDLIFDGQGKCLDRPGTVPVTEKAAGERDGTVFVGTAKSGIDG
jgi:hypothetical protein